MGDSHTGRSGVASMDPLDPHLQQEGRISTSVHPQVQAIGPFTCRGCQGGVFFENGLRRRFLHPKVM